MSDLISRARALVQTQQADIAIGLLESELESNAENVPFLSVYAEALMEVDRLDNAYEVLHRACELDPEAAQGSDKFLYLGQIIGGQDGLTCLDTGLQRLAQENESASGADALVIKKMNQAIFHKIEIWMTDLCMELEAESQCDSLITYALQLDATSPEAHSLLASIRISQQRPEEAKDALVQSWHLFESRKAQLEEAANSAGANASSTSDAFDVSIEYIELLQPLTTLAQYAIELELYEIAITIISATQDIDENVLSLYYLEALAHLLAAKILVQQKDVPDYRDITIAQLKQSTEESIASNLAEARSCLTQAYKIINSNNEEGELDPDVVEQVNQWLEELGGPVLKELMPQRDRDDYEGWEDEIVSGEE